LTPKRPRFTDCEATCLERAEPHAGRDLSGRRHRGAGRLCPLRPWPSEDLSVVVGILYAIGAIFIAVYMVAALLRPDKF
jgi:hypothetical protein